jgi:CRISPR/Cas system-associated exonuclease Cas4 (RecB family)
MYKSPLLREQYLYKELRIEHPIGDDIIFKGFIDLVTFKEKSGMFYISDFKTTKKGWDSKDKNDFMKRVQLYLYQIYLSEKLDIPIDKFICRFILLRGNSRDVETFELPYDEGALRKSKELLLSVVDTLYNEKNGLYKFKNEYSCLFCPFKSGEQKQFCSNEDENGYKIVLDKDKAVLKEYAYDEQKEKQLYLPWRDINIKQDSNVGYDLTFDSLLKDYKQYVGD